MYGISEFAAVINPPQGCILAVGAGEQRPVVKDDALAIATVMICTLSVDHRVVDGAVGAQFLPRSRSWSKTRWQCCSKLRRATGVASDVLTARAD